LNFNPFLPIGTFPEFSQNSFEKGQVVACSYSKEKSSVQIRTMNQQLEESYEERHSKDLSAFHKLLASSR
jgi:hypothetical protein